MSAADLSPIRHRPTRDIILRALGDGATRWKLRDRLSQSAIAEKFGKEPEKDTGAAYLNGERDPGATGLLIAFYEDEQFANDVMAEVLGRKLCPIEVEVADHNQTARDIARFLNTLLDELAVDEDGDGDALDRAGTLVLDKLIAALEPKLAAIRARAARIRKGGR